jgi:hypothetical protein
VLLDSPVRRRRRRPRIGRWLLALALLAAIAGGIYAWRSQVEAGDARQEAAERFAAAWGRGDHAAMWRELTARSREATPERRFVTAYRNADREAGVEKVTIGRPGAERDGRVAVPVSIETDIFGTLRGTVAVPVSGRGDEAGVDWDFSLRLPGLRRDEAVVRRAGRQPRSGSVLADDGSPLDLSAIADGLEEMYEERLNGHPSAQLLFGERVVARTRAERGRNVRTTIDPGLTRAARSALGDRLGGVAVIRPRDRDVRFRRMSMGGMRNDVQQRHQTGGRGGRLSRRRPRRRGAGRRRAPLVGRRCCYHLDGRRPHALRVRHEERRQRRLRADDPPRRLRHAEAAQQQRQRLHGVPHLRRHDPESAGLRRRRVRRHLRLVAVTPVEQ